MRTTKPITSSPNDKSCHAQLETPHKNSHSKKYPSESMSRDTHPLGFFLDQLGVKQFPKVRADRTLACGDSRNPTPEQTANLEEIGKCDAFHLEHWDFAQRQGQYLRHVCAPREGHLLGVLPPPLPLPLEKLLRRFAESSREAGLSAPAPPFPPGVSGADALMSAAPS